ncbi:galactokinase [bacterium]|nr:galactokinase [bacterium]
MNSAALKAKLEAKDPSVLEVLLSVNAQAADVAEEARQRLINAITVYEKTFASEEVVVVRAPGRVNLIGEHTDYNGFPVMPMAISRDMLIVAGASKDNVISFANVIPSFQGGSFTIERNIPPYQSGDWGNYIKSATQGLIDFWGTEEGLKGLKMVIDGNVPLASGLSSSAAFTVAAAEAILAINGRTIDPVVFAEVMAKSDHYVGMASGGMDQSISILGQAGKCLKIDFYPIRTQLVTLPKEADILVCHSRVKAAKAGNARIAYNMRTVECRIAYMLLHKLAGKAGAKEPTMLYDWFANETEGFDDALNKIETALVDEGYTVKMIAEALGVSEEYAAKEVCLTKTGEVMPEPPGGFQVKKRARHVISEARRVEDSVKLLNGDSDNKAEAFGLLMDQSHASCRDDYEISCEELNALVEAGKAAGSYGSRLTGAGFGGCTVHLIPKGKGEEFIKKIHEAYYLPHDLDGYADNQYLFAPAQGAGVLFN